MSCNEKVDDAFIPGSSKDKDENKDENGSSDLTADNHPRLLMTSEDFTALQDKLSSNADETLTLLHNTIMGVSRSTGMNSTPLTYKLDASNKRILDVSRNALVRIFSCAYAYRMTGETQFLIKAETDINAVCNFINWNAERHFLDAAEMATAVAFGYDWLYHDLSESTLNNAANALQKFAFQPALNGVWNLNFYEALNNWNQVCNGGLVTAALAVYERFPKEADQIIEKALQSNATAVAAMYSPDGNYSEGPSYWCYGTIYQALMLSVLDSALGSDDGLSNISGFSKTGEYMLYTVGLNNRFFNYADCAAGAVPALALWYFADKFNDPSLLYNEIRMLQNGRYSTSSEVRLLPMLMAYAKNLTLDDIQEPTKKVWSGKGETPVVMVHTDWTFSDTDKYLGIKGGKGNSSHGHLDAGSFVYDAYGVRWSMDFGLQSYTTLETQLAALGGNLWDMGQNSMRWDVFRLNNLNHSTISINDARHIVSGSATLTTVINSDTELGATLDLTPVVSNQAASAIRTVKIVDDKDLVVIDRIAARSDRTAKVRWTMVTPATPTVQGNGIILTFGNKSMRLSTTGTSNITYKTWSTTSSNSYDAANPSTYMVGFESTISANQSITFTTTLTPN